MYDASKDAAKLAKCTVDCLRLEDEDRAHSRISQSIFISLITSDGTGLVKYANDWA